MVPGKTDLLVPPRDAEELGQAILDLLGDEATGERMGQAGRQRVEERFIMEKTADRMETIMEEHLAEIENGEDPGRRSFQEGC